MNMVTTLAVGVTAGLHGALYGGGRALTQTLRIDPAVLGMQTAQVIGLAARAAAGERPAPFLVYQESDAVTRALRDYLSDDIGEVLIDEPGSYARALEYVQRFLPPEAQRQLKQLDMRAWYDRSQAQPAWSSGGSGCASRCNLSCGRCRSLVVRWRCSLCVASWARHGALRDWR